jgi:hypothetical protein
MHTSFTFQKLYSPLLLFRAFCLQTNGTWRNRHGRRQAIYHIFPNFFTYTKFYKRNSPFLHVFLTGTVVRKSNSKLGSSPPTTTRYKRTKSNMDWEKSINISYAIEKNTAIDVTIGTLTTNILLYRILYHVSITWRSLRYNVSVTGICHELKLRIY